MNSFVFSTARETPRHTSSRWGFLVRRHAAFKTTAIALLFVSCFGSCVPEKKSIFSLKIIRWQCKHLDDRTSCHLTTRRYSPDAFEAGVVQEYWDSAGNKINTCNQCQRGNGSLPATQNKDFEDVTPQTGFGSTPPDPNKTFDPNKTWAISYVEADDEDVRVFVVLLPDTLKINKYKFYFTDPGSGRTISNTVEGTVFDSQSQ